MKVEFRLDIGFAGSVHKEVIELDDDLSNEEIDEEYEYWADNYINRGWHKLEEV